MVLRLRGGGGLLPHQMAIAAGGSIRQTIRRDPYRSHDWHKNAVIVFNVQILNSDVFECITGHEPPPSPITAQTYAELGLPFFTIEDKASGVSGAFDKVQSVAEICGQEEKSVTLPIQYLNEQGHAIDPNSVTATGTPNVYQGGAGGDIVNPRGPFSEFLCIGELREELQKLVVEE